MTDKKPAQNPDFVAALAALTARHCLTDTQAAGLLGVPLATWRKWAAGTRAPSAAAVHLLGVLCTLDALAPALLAAMIPAPTVPAKRGRKPSGAKSPL